MVYLICSTKSFFWPRELDLLGEDKRLRLLCQNDMELAESVNRGQTPSGETSEMYIIFVTVLFVISSCLLAGNLLAIISILLFTKRKKTFSLLLITLSITEVLNIIGPNAMSLYVFFDEANNFHTLFTLCRVQAWAIVFVRTATTLLITLLGLDRAFITVIPRFYRRQWKGKLAILYYFGIWIIAAFVATWPLLWLDGFHMSRDAQDTFCLFLYKNPFAGFFVLFLLCSLVVCCFCFCVIFSKSHKKSFSTMSTTDKNITGSAPKQQAVVMDTRDVHSSEKYLTRIAALIVAIYFCCYLPWMVVITLGIFSIQYPPLFGLCAMQLPMVSGLLNPLIYGITWTPYRRAYIQALKWPFAKCCNRRFKTSPRSRSHNLDSTMSARHSFWISDNFTEEDADHENAFQILFGPTSYIKPLDFNPEELEMFEQNSKQAGSLKPNCVYPSPLESKTTMWREHGNNFQNILDFIEEMTEGNIRQRSKSFVKGIKTNTEAYQSSQTNGDIRSAYNTSPPIRPHDSDLSLSFCGEGVSQIPGVERCAKHKHGVACYCLGKSKCYVVEGKTRDNDYLVSTEIESISSGEAVNCNRNLTLT